MLAGGAATLTALASLAESDTELLDVIYEELPAGSHLEFDQAATFVAELRAELVRREGYTSSAKRANVLAALGYRYVIAGRRVEALAPAEEAEDIYRRLADPETGNPPPTCPTSPCR